MTISLFLVIVFGGIVIAIILLRLNEIGFDWYSKFFEKKEEMVEENKVENKSLSFVFFAADLNQYKNAMNG